jgi:predicted PurR-regulated permease PerM
MPEVNLDSPPADAAPQRSRLSVSAGIIATGVVFVFLYFASSVVISLICAIFIAFVLEPGVKLLERLRLPRWLGAMVIMLATLAVMYLVGYLIYDRALTFVNDLPNYTARLREILTHVRVTFLKMQLSTSSLIPPEGGHHVPLVRLQPESTWMQYLLRGLGTAYGFIVSVMFIPFLVFFMLASKDHFLRASVGLFPSQMRRRAGDVIHGISVMVREYVIGNLLVALISAVLIMPFFAWVHLRFWLLLSLLAGFLSLIPYIGVALALLPPLLMALVEPQYKTVFPFLVIALVIVAVHFVAINVLTPKLVGGRVKLNALSVTIAMMFWGWLWGGIGLILAVPITAAFKAICDNVDALKPYGAWMGESIGLPHELGTVPPPKPPAPA